MSAINEKLTNVVIETAQKQVMGGAVEGLGAGKTALVLLASFGITTAFGKLLKPALKAAAEAIVK